MAAPPIPPLACPAPRLRRGGQGILRVAVDEVNVQLIVTFQRAIEQPEEDFLLDPRSYSLTGGQRLFPRVIAVEVDGAGSPPVPEDGLRLRLSSLGDFSIYTLTITGPGLDPFFDSHKLRFRVACDDPFDCRPPAAPAGPAPSPPPESA